MKNQINKVFIFSVSKSALLLKNAPKNNNEILYAERYFLPLDLVLDVWFSIVFFFISDLAWLIRWKLQRCQRFRATKKQ